MRLQRIQLDSNYERDRLMELTGAGFEDWWKRFHVTHPEYFALQPDGTRGYLAELGPHTVKICCSNPAVWEQWLADVADQLKENPTQTDFNAAWNDGYLSGHCICENCRAWDNPDAERMRFIWKGVSQEYVSLSDRNITFANAVARLLKKRYPGKELYVVTQAYGNWRTVPVKAVPDDNVIVQSVTDFLLFSGKRRETAIKEYKGWADISHHIVWRPNLHGAWWQGLPATPLHQIIEDLQFVARNKCEGMFFASTWENWATQGPAYYIMAQLAWNPDRDGQALLDDYYRRGFGPAAGDIQSYWSLMEETYLRTTSRTTSGSSVGEPVYDAAFFARAGEILNHADAALAGERDVFRKRVALLRTGLEYTRLLTELKGLTERLKKNSGTDDEAEKQARADVDRLKLIFRENKDTINGACFGSDRAHMRGIYPDFNAKRSDSGSGAKKTAAQSGVVQAPSPAAVATTPGQARAAESQTAEKAGWKLAFSDDFKRQELGPNWVVVNGDWKVQDGCLRGSGTLLSARGFPEGDAPGFQRLEFDAVTDAKPAFFLKDNPAPKVDVCDLSSILHARAPQKGKDPLETSYLFQFGGQNNTLNRVMRAGVTLREDSKPEKMITPGQVQRIVVENDQGTLRLSVNGEVRLECREKQSLLDLEQNRCGFYFCTTAKVFNVRLYVKQLDNGLDM
jgi:hypothetical protein